MGLTCHAPFDPANEVAMTWSGGVRGVVALGLGRPPRRGGSRLKRTGYSLCFSSNDTNEQQLVASIVFQPCMQNQHQFLGLQIIKSTNRWEFFLESVTLQLTFKYRLHCRIWNNKSNEPLVVSCCLQADNTYSLVNQSHLIYVSKKNCQLEKHRLNTLHGSSTCTNPFYH